LERGRVVREPFRWMERITGVPDASGLQHRIINLLLFVAFLSGAAFLVSDTLLALEPIHVFNDLGMISLFGTLFWHARFRKRYRIVAHGGTLAGLAFATTNFFVNAGIVGPTLMVILMVLAFVTIVPPPGGFGVCFCRSLFVSVLSGSPEAPPRMDSPLPLARCALLGCDLHVRLLPRDDVLRHAHRDALLPGNPGPHGAGPGRRSPIGKDGGPGRIAGHPGPRDQEPGSRHRVGSFLFARLVEG